MDIELLKTTKKKRKMTLQQIADQSGIPKRTVDDIFSGHTKNPRIDTVEAIERALGISSDGITPEERAAGASATRRVDITPIEDEMFYVFREIGKRHGEAAQRALITVAEKML